MSDRAGRNESCPCGSGRKYKHCCLRAPASPARDLAKGHFNEAVALYARGRLDEAVARYRAATALAPDFFEAHVNLGNVLRHQGHLEEALGCFRRGLELRPAQAELNLNVALSLHAMGRLNEAIAAYRAALPRRAGDFQVHNNLALALCDAGAVEQAQESLRTALALEAGSAVVHFTLGRVLVAQSRVAEAIASYRRALELDPTLRKAHSGLLLALLYSDSEAPAAVWREHRRFADRFEAPLRPDQPVHSNPVDPARRLRVGYVSPDLRAHSVAYFLEPVLARHDRSHFEVYCYYTAPVRDAVTERLCSLADRWLDCATFTDRQLADRIGADGIDVLVDLSGHTAGHRLLVFARKPAPVQASWLGYPCATGLRSIDWRLTDPYASPPDPAPQPDVEPLVRLSPLFCCYRPPEDAPEPASPDGGCVTLGSFNNAAKISDSAIRLWSRVLLSQPSLRLMLKDTCFADEGARGTMRSRFAALGVDAARLTLLARSASERDHLGMYGRVDIALDTFPYCGVTTTCEALWMGVPVVSLVGSTFASRMGLTLLTAVGHPEWAAACEDGYVERVLALAADSALRASLRTHLRERMRASPLTDQAGFTRRLEAAYRSMWRRWCESAAPASGMRAD